MFWAVLFRVQSRYDKRDDHINFANPKTFLFAIIKLRARGAKRNLGALGIFARGCAFA